MEEVEEIPSQVAKCTGCKRAWSFVDGTGHLSDLMLAQRANGHLEEMHGQHIKDTIRSHFTWALEVGTELDGLDMINRFLQISLRRPILPSEANMTYEPEIIWKQVYLLLRCGRKDLASAVLELQLGTVVAKAVVAWINDKVLEAHAQTALMECQRFWDLSDKEKISYGREQLLLITAVSGSDELVSKLLQSPWLCLFSDREEIIWLLLSMIKDQSNSFGLDDFRNCLKVCPDNAKDPVVYAYEKLLNLDFHSAINHLSTDEGRGKYYYIDLVHIVMLLAVRKITLSGSAEDLCAERIIKEYGCRYLSSDISSSLEYYIRAVSVVPEAKRRVLCKEILICLLSHDNGINFLSTRSKERELTRLLPDENIISIQNFRGQVVSALEKDRRLSTKYKKIIEKENKKRKKDAEPTQKRSKKRKGDGEVVPQQTQKRKADAEAVPQPTQKRSKKRQGDAERVLRVICSDLEISEALLLSVTEAERVSQAGDDCGGVLVLREGGSSVDEMMTAVVHAETQSLKCFNHDPKDVKILPMNGKPINAKRGDWASNKFVEKLIAKLGLILGKEYTDVESLNFKELVVAADPDYDGAHITALIINLFHVGWPSLLKLKFLSTLLIPAVIVLDKANNNAQEEFFSLRAFENWEKTQKAKHGTWDIIFRRDFNTEDLSKFITNDKYKKEFLWTKEADSIIEKAFGFLPENQERKSWILDEKLPYFLNHEGNTINIGDYFNFDLRAFAMADVLRSLPMLADGLTSNQRKIMFSFFEGGILIDKDQTVDVISRIVAAKTNYRSGTDSLAESISLMCYKGPTSSNMNLLRMRTGTTQTEVAVNYSNKPVIAYRYMTGVELTPGVRQALFKEDDDAFLEKRMECQRSFEPNWYMPVVPLALLNGGTWLAYGFRSFIPNYRLEDIIANLRRKLVYEGLEFIDMFPWYKNMKGTIHRLSEGEYICTGILEKDDDDTLRITELPFNMLADEYEKILEKLKREEDSKKFSILVLRRRKMYWSRISNLPLHSQLMLCI